SCHQLDTSLGRSLVTSFFIVGAVEQHRSRGRLAHQDYPKGGVSPDTLDVSRRRRARSRRRKYASNSARLWTPKRPYNDLKVLVRRQRAHAETRGDLFFAITLEEASESFPLASRKSQWIRIEAAGKRFAY